MTKRKTERERDTKTKATKTKTMKIWNTKIQSTKEHAGINYGEPAAIVLHTNNPYPLDRNFGIPGPFGHGNRLPTCKYLAMQPQLCGGGLGAL